MAIRYRIVEKLYGTTETFQFWDLDMYTDRPVLTNPRNDLTIDQTRDILGHLHFKTSEGASIFKIQEILPTEIEIEKADSAIYTPVDIDAVWANLTDINFFEWWMGSGGGSSGVTKFVQLLDAFGFTGKAGQFARVNSSETALEAATVYSFPYITQHFDWGDNNPLQVSDIGKRVVIGNVAGQANFILDDDTSNVPVAPNEILIANVTKSGNIATLQANGLWRINGIQYSNGLDVPVSIPYTSAGKYRFDLLVLDENNTMQRVAGTEVDLAQTAIFPPRPANTLTVSTLLVREDSMDITPEPVGTPYITKTSFGAIELLGSVQVDNIELTNRTTIRVNGSVTAISGFAGITTAPVGDENYNFQEFRITNLQNDAVILLNENGDSGVPFFFPDGNDLSLLKQETAEFYFDQALGIMRFKSCSKIGGGSSAITLRYTDYFNAAVGVPYQLKTGVLLDENFKIFNYNTGQFVTGNAGQFTYDPVGNTITFNEFITVDGELVPNNEVSNNDIIFIIYDYTSGGTPTPPSGGTFDDSFDDSMG